MINSTVFKGRREVISLLAKSAGLSILLATPGISIASILRNEEQPFTVGQVIDLFLKEIPNAPFDKTVDTLKAGNRGLTVKGIVTTMFATIEVIQKSIAQGANFIIAHEPTFYNHQDEVEWLDNDPVYRFKEDLLKQNNMAVWRCHDYIHAHRPDGVMSGLLKALGWEKYSDAGNPGNVTLPPVSLNDLIVHAKSKLGIKTLRYSGELKQPCRRVLLMPGAAGGKRQIESIGRVKPDVIICGELSEWETAEYVRDAQLEGQKLSLVVLGHAASEEPGLEWMASWLQSKLPGIKITHMPSRNPLSFV